MSKRLLALAAIILAPMAALSPAAAQTPLFADNSELAMVIEGPVQTLVRRAARNTDPLPAVVEVDGQRYDIQLSPRGISRRTGGICNFPPLRLEFTRSAVRGTLFEGQRRLKLVTRCRPGATYEQLTVLEYTAYRLYNEISPLSYRVRPLAVTYRDRRNEAQFNFLIEDGDDMARRNGLRELDLAPDAVHASQLNPQATARYALFQFMIGNLDWDMVSGRGNEECCHNSRLFAATAETRDNVFPAPYDFDYAGLVNAPYALPPASLPVRNVRQRYYRGYCRFNGELPEAIAHFQSRREALLAVIAGERRLNDARRQGAIAYVEAFFAILDNPREVERQIIGRCR